ncbi:hypothetical protein FSP39_024325 [Pinctada imbricata]|uniref:Uncharacterized protein n=1 Tax=Pinctada imbricata TaxID=66713 RepID=A0AA89C378_PINIB|nr:hypothetical protein FSP39_024325 [Pinctada imbricata]
MTGTEQTASISTTSESEIDQKAVDSQSSDQSELKTDLHLKEDNMKDDKLLELKETKSDNADLVSNIESEMPLNSSSEDAPIMSRMEEVAEITSQVQDESTVGETASDTQKDLHSDLQESNDMDNVAQEKSEILNDTSNVIEQTEEELSAVIDTLNSDNQQTDEQTDLTTEDAKEDIKDDDASFVPKEESSMNEETKDSSSSSGHIQTEITSADTIVQNEENGSIFVEKPENEQSISKEVLLQKAEQASPECNLDVLDKNSDLDSVEKGSEQKDIVHEKREDSIQEKESMDIVSKESPIDDKNMIVENIESLKVGKDSEKEVCHSEFETKDNSVVESSKSDERLITDHLQAGTNSDVTEVSESVDNEGKSSSVDIATIDIPESTEKQDTKEKEAVQVETESGQQRGESRMRIREGIHMMTS